MNVRRSKATRRVAALGTVGAALAAGLVAASPAGATVIETGALEVHAAGSVYAGSGAFASTIVAAGGAGTYSILVANTGSVAGQFNLEVDRTQPTDPTTVVVTAGSNVTAQAMGADGFYTPVIAAHKTLAVTVKITMPKTSSIADRFFTGVTLRDLHGATLDTEVLETMLKSASTAQPDMVVTGAGQQGVVGVVDYTNVTAPSLNVNGSNTFTIKLVNDSQTTTPIAFSLADGAHCGAYFVPTVKAGSTVITAAALAGTYQTASLAKGKSATITVAVKFLGTPAAGACYYPYDVLQVQSHGVLFGAAQSVNLVTNPAAGKAAMSFAPTGPDAVRLSPVYSPSDPYVATCPSADQCSSPTIEASDGSASVQITSANAANPYVVTAYLGGPTNPCTATSGAAANFSVSAPDADKQVTYAVYGAAADQAAAVSMDLPNHVCYESPNDFVGYYPNGGVWSHQQDCYCGDGANFGMVPIDPTTGDYLGLLADCSITSGLEPCLLNAGTFDLSGPVSNHSFTVTVIAPAGDPKMTN